MREYIEIGCSPSDEPCVNVGEENYGPRARKECFRFVELLRKTFGPEPEGAQLTVKKFPHDFGDYYEVVCWFDDEFPESWEYALRLEAETPTKWEE